MPSPRRARCTGSATRASAKTTLPTPPLSALKAESTFFFIRPCAIASAASSVSPAKGIWRTRLASSLTSARRPGVFEKMSSASAPSATASSIASLSPSTLIASPSVLMAGGVRTGK